MEISGLTPMLRTWDFEGSIDFYTRLLGGTRDERDESWASLRIGSASIMLAGPNAHTEERAAAFTGSLYLRTEDVDACWSAVKDQARVCYPIETMDYGMREFAVYDNNGYLLQFGQPASASASHDLGQM